MPSESLRRAPLLRRTQASHESQPDLAFCSCGNLVQRCQGDGVVCGFEKAVESCWAGFHLIQSHTDMEAQRKKEKQNKLGDSAAKALLVTSITKICA